MLPVFLPAIPFAFVLGIVIMDSGIAPLLGWSSSPMIYGGASQLALLTLLSDGAAIAAAVTAALVVNARHLMYSAAMAPTFQQQPTWFRWVGPYFLIDQVFALAMPRIHDEPESFRTYYLTLGIVFWLLWLSATAAGLFLGPVIPPSWGLSFSIPILFLGMLVMTINRWRADCHTDQAYCWGLRPASLLVCCWTVGGDDDLPGHSCDRRWHLLQPRHLYTDAGQAPNSS
jgi:predicted branched-subunit amino acid permease